MIRSDLTYAGAFIIVVGLKTVSVKRRLVAERFPNGAIALRL
jgi:hypothetical protein